MAELRTRIRTPSRRPRQVLTPGGEAFLRAVAPVVLGPLIDVDRPPADAALGEAVDAIDDYLAYLSPPLQRQIRVTLAMLASLPVRAALLRTPAPWSAAPAARVEGALTALRQSRIPALRRLFGVLHSLVVLGWFDLPLVWQEIGYPGPPAESAVVRGAAR